MAIPSGQRSPSGIDGPSPGTEYARRLFDNILDWYKSADAKAQIILTLDGVFLSFITSTLFSKRVDIGQVLHAFRPTTWTFLSLMCLSIGASIISAIWCLWSRLRLPGTIPRAFGKAGLDVEVSASYKPKFMWFFQHVKYLDASQIAERLQGIDEGFEIQARAAQIKELAKNVTAKHWAVNAGFVFFGVGLFMFLLAAVTYVRTF